ncbi:Glycosyl transferase, group 2 family [hydrothermal vent metagenome]|uniref:Glycosyl transferase, group 2 family n=1 Tax=hydrothermal vent metagenome TaxID=652676 RepID=A0A3B0YQH9_9ZZZZ
MLSIIIPCLNEVKQIPALLSCLNQQHCSLHFEVLLVDGGSHDGTLLMANKLKHQLSYNLRLLSSRPSRAIQMNYGAHQAKGSDLLFLHSDSLLSAPDSLQQAAQHMTRKRPKNENIAGHFALRFKRDHTNNPVAYYFYEAKTHLNKQDTINGDQGFWLNKAFFNQLGGFDESLAFMEDARLAGKIFKQGAWTTLPALLQTSARRFETEGLRQRQVLNALLCAFNHIGMTNYFNQAGSAYCSQVHTKQLDLYPFFKLAHDVSFEYGFITALTRWYGTGKYVASNAWQLAFALDCRKNQSMGLPPGEGELLNWRIYKKTARYVVESWFGYGVTAILTFLWFYVSLGLQMLSKNT